MTTCGSPPWLPLYLSNSVLGPFEKNVEIRPVNGHQLAEESVYITKPIQRQSMYVYIIITKKEEDREEYIQEKHEEKFKEKKKKMQKKP